MKMRLIDGEVVDLSLDPSDSYHQQIAEEFVDVPEDAPEELSPGFRYVDGIWTPPRLAPVDEAPEVVPANKTLVSVARFMSQFPLESQIKIELAMAYVPSDPANPDQERAVRKAGLDVLYRQLSYLNQRNSEVDVADPSVQQGVDWMASEGLITQDDAERIKRGVPS